MQIRPLTSTDAPAWREIRLEMLAAHPLAFGSTHADWVDRPLSDFAAWLDKVEIMGTFEGDRLVATMGWFKRPGKSASHRGLIVAVYVRPALRGQHLLDALLGALIPRALKAGILQLELDVATDNAPARAAYARNGFVETGRIPRALRHGDVFVDEVMMLRDLGT